VLFLGRIMCCMIYYELLFQFYARVWFFSVFCRFFYHFTLILTINECSLTPDGHPQVIMPVEGRKNIIVSKQSSPRMVCNENHGPW